MFKKPKNYDHASLSIYLNVKRILEGQWKIIQKANNYNKMACKDVGS